MLDRCGHRHFEFQSAAAATAPTMSASSTTFSLFFPLPPKVDYDDHSSITTSPSSPSSSSSSAGSVDCTLSLGTPSSRRAAETSVVPTKHGAPASHPKVSAWDVAADQSSYHSHQGSKPAGGAASRVAAHDAFADRRCANCGTTSTPLWRNGPRGPKSLCNACGIRFKKEERRAAATAAMENGGAGCGYSAQRAQYEYGAAAAKASSTGAVSCGEGAFPCGGDADANAPFLAWRLNVVAPAVAPAFAAVWPERTSLFQYN